jgi:hypothetical protein
LGLGLNIGEVSHHMVSLFKPDQMVKLMEAVQSQVAVESRWLDSIGQFR